VTRTTRTESIQLDRLTARHREAVPRPPPLWGGPGTLAIDAHNGGSQWVVQQDDAQALAH
jgi:hypothetical protein